MKDIIYRLLNYYLCHTGKKINVYVTIVDDGKDTKIYEQEAIKGNEYIDQLVEGLGEIFVTISPSIPLSISITEHDGKNLAMVTR